MLTEIVLTVVTLVCLLYWYITKSFGKWKKLGIPYDEGYFPYGSYNILAQKKHFSDLAEEGYRKFRDEKYYGWFLFGKPVLGINDMELLKNIQVKDFNHFVDRNESNTTNIFKKGGELDKLWGKQLTLASGDEWKDIRSTFTPIFTSGKMKTMLKFVKHVAGDLVKEIGEKAVEETEFELKDVFGKFSLDSLASAAFGVDAESFTNEKSVFVKNAAKMFINDRLDTALIALKFIPGIPFVFEFFKININKPKETKYFVDVITQTINTRRQTQERKNDLVDLMMDCIKEESKCDEQEDEDAENQYENDMKLTHTKKKKQLDELVIVATAMILLVAGYDTTGMLLSYLAYETSKNPEIQEKLQEEVDQAFEDANGKFPDYNTIQNLPYLDMVIHETLRLHTAVGLNTRSCNEDYHIPGTDITIKKNDLLSICAQGIHSNPEFYSHPHQFYPEHFSKENKATRSPYAFQAFGQGPRACIGMRFALLEAKVAVLSVFREFSFLPGTKTLEPLERDPPSQLGYAKGGLWARVIRRDLQE